MKREQMIAEIQRQEAALFLMLKQTEAIWGTDNTLTRIDRSRWGAIIDLMADLGIKSDLTLPDSKQALAMILAERDKAA